MKSVSALDIKAECADRGFIEIINAFFRLEIDIRGI